MLARSGRRAVRRSAARTSSAAASDPAGPIRSSVRWRAGRSAAQLHAVPVLAPVRDVGHEIDAERAARRDRPARPRRASPSDRAAGSATAGCRTARAPSGTLASSNGSARMSPRTNRMIGDRAVCGDLTDVGDARGRASAPSDRRRRARRPLARAASRRGRSRSRARAPARPPSTRHGARTARRGGRASARSPSRRTARTRPTLPAFADRSSGSGLGHRLHANPEPRIAQSR